MGKGGIFRMREQGYMFNREIQRERERNRVIRSTYLAE